MQIGLKRRAIRALEGGGGGSYLGKIVHLGEVYDGRHEPVIDPVLFERVQEILAANQVRAYRDPPDRKYDYLLTGLAFDSAGGALTPKPGVGRSGRWYPYYEASGRSKKADHDCEVARVRAEDLEEGVLAAIRGLCQAPDLVGEAVERANHLAADRTAPLRQRVAELRRTLQQARDQAERVLVGVIAAGVDASPTAKRRLRDAEERIRQLEAEVAEAEQQVREAEGSVIESDVLLTALQSFDAIWDNLSVSERRELIEAMVDRVEVRRAGLFLHLYDGRALTTKLPQLGRRSRSGLTAEQGVRLGSEKAPRRSPQQENLHVLGARLPRGPKAPAWRGVAAVAAVADGRGSRPRRGVAEAARLGRS